MTQYAQYNPDTFQMIGSPASLPTRWTTPEGATINNFDTLPQRALFALGWAPVVYEPLPDSEWYSHRIVASWDEANGQFVYPAIAKDLAVLLVQAKTVIDAAAGDACARHLSIGHAQDLRYAEKACEIKAYLADADPDPADYPVMMAEATACGMTLAEKAVEIATARETWVVLCAAIEAARIGGKRACAASEGAAAMLARRDEAVAILEAL